MATKECEDCRNRKLQELYEEEGEFIMNTLKQKTAKREKKESKSNPPSVWFRDAPEYLHRRIDTLENVLCDVATADLRTQIIWRDDLKKALQDAGILGKQEVEK